jgi:hypothetical protein
MRAQVATFAGWLIPSQFACLQATKKLQNHSVYCWQHNQDGEATGMAVISSIAGVTKYFEPG